MRYGEPDTSVGSWRAGTARENGEAGGDGRSALVIPSGKSATDVTRKASRNAARNAEPHQHGKPIPVLIGELNRHLEGWMDYFSSSSTSSDAVHDRTDRRKARFGCTTGAVGAAPSVGKCEKPKARAFRRAGRGKPASPVQRVKSGRATRAAFSPTPSAEIVRGMGGL